MTNKCVLVVVGLAAAFACAAAFGPAKKPHVLFILVDDLGHAELGYNRATADKEVVTPSINQLVQDGVKLDRHYVHKFCSPTRCAIQSGRAPIHVNVINAAPEVSNPADPVGGYAGMPLNMTGIAEVLKRAGYATHFAGKWDVGMATNEHTPVGRGYDTTLNYYHHTSDYYTFRYGACTGANGSSAPPRRTPMVDLWNYEPGVDNMPRFGRGARRYANSPHCSDKNQKPQGPNQTCVFADTLFEERVTEVVRSHNATVPLFMFWATHIVHGPLQVPDEQLAKFSFINDTTRQTYHAMVNWIDGAIGRVVDATKAKGLYDDMLIVFSSDNGGPLSSNAQGGGANNYPLKGGKFSNWEGGIRVAAFASGGFIPPSRRGTAEAGLAAGWDWYATLAGLAGVDPTDHRAAQAGLPPIDSLDLWPLISGANATSPRAELHIGSNEGGDGGRNSGATLVGGLIVPPYKILVGDLDYAGWPGPESPSQPYTKYSRLRQVCGRTVETGCLFNVFADPEERTNIIAANQGVWTKLLARMDEVQKTVFSPSRGATDPRACEMGLKRHGFWGPFVDQADEL